MRHLSWRTKTVKGFQPRFITGGKSGLMGDIVQAIRYAPVRCMEHARWPYFTHSCVLECFGTCSACGRVSVTVLVSVTEALPHSVRSILSGIYPHRCGGWSEDSVAALETSRSQQSHVGLYTDQPYTS